VTTAQAGALFFVRKNNGCLLRELSRGLMLDSSAITGMVDRLEKKDFFKRNNSTSDRRAINIYMTDGGNEAASKALSVVKEYNRAITRGFSREEIDTFKRMLHSIVKGFGGKEGQSLAEPAESSTDQNF